MDEQLNQLAAYIKQHLHQGVPESHIRHTLLQHHWHAEHVDRAFALATVPQKYKLFRAVGEAFQAMQNNGTTFLLSVLASYAITAVSLFVVTLIIGIVLYGAPGTPFTSTSKLTATVFGSLVFGTVWYALAGAFTLTTTSLALYDGCQNHKSSLKAVLSRSFSRFGRVAAANALLCLVLIWPAALAVLLPFLFLAGGADNLSLVILMPVLGLIAVAWAYIAIIRFALAPYVALFEPNVPLMKTLGRSKHLLVKGGQWFLVKGLLSTIFVLVLVATISGKTLSQLADSSNIVLNICAILLSIVANGTLVMLYRNRSQVRPPLGPQ